MHRPTVLALCLLLAAPAAAAAAPPPRTPAQTPEQIAEAALKEAPVWDGHNDVAEQLRDRTGDMLGQFDFRDTTHAKAGSYGPGGMQTDLTRLRQGHVGAQFWSAYVSADLPEPEAVRETLEQIDTIKRLAARYPADMQYATSADDVVAAMKAGKVASLIGVEGGHSIENSLDKLRQLYAQGARYMTLTWNNGNDWAGSSVGLNGTRTGGLTDFGKDVVHEMNRLGMLVDISHVSDSTFFDAVAASKDPVIASHSSSRALGGHPRDMSDDMLRAVAQNGGVVNVNFFELFLDPKFAAAYDSIHKAADAERQTAAAAPGADTAAVRAHYDSLADAQSRAMPRVALSVLIDHIDHIAKVAGVDHVGLGSDFDDVDAYLPADMLDVTYLPNIAQGLIDRGYTDADVTKILGGNMMRVIEIVLDRKPAKP
jgi:membrane dipeptidase